MSLSCACERPNVRLHLLRFPLILLTLTTLFLLAGNSQTARANTLVVSAGGDVQAAINAANYGDTIVLQAGATYTVPGLENPFLLKNKGAGTGTDADYITIRTSDDASLPVAGDRPVLPSDAPHLARLITNKSSAVIEAEANAHHYRLIGLEITNVGG
ncbi:MAG TPA: hypothetical protein VE775_04730, partial [Pyrinomonadaceae bacterium]|nr:hypothetical protein [Pyrinomonadaceae bacterium]